MHVTAQNRNTSRNGGGGPDVTVPEHESAEHTGVRAVRGSSRSRLPATRNRNISVSEVARRLLGADLAVLVAELQMPRRMRGHKGQHTFQGRPSTWPSGTAHSRRPGPPLRMPCRDRSGTAPEPARAVGSARHGARRRTRGTPTDACCDACPVPTAPLGGDIFAMGAAIGSWVKRSRPAQKGHCGQAWPIG